MAVAVTGTLSAGSSDRQTKHNQEELPHVRGQGQKLGGSYARRAVAKRSYPASEVRGSSRECQAATAQEWLRGATQVQGRGGGREEQPHIQGAVAAQVQEDMEELSHIEGQEGWW